MVDCFSSPTVLLVGAAVALFIAAELGITAILVHLSTRSPRARR